MLLDLEPGSLGLLLELQSSTGLVVVLDTLLMVLLGGLLLLDAPLVLGGLLPSVAPLPLDAPVLLLLLGGPMLSDAP